MPAQRRAKDRYRIVAKPGKIDWTKLSPLPLLCRLHGHCCDAATKIVYTPGPLRIWKGEVVSFEELWTAITGDAPHAVHQCGAAMIQT